ILVQNFGHLARAYGAAAFTDSEAQTFLHSDLVDQLNFDRYVVARHNHFNALRQLHFAGNVRGAEVELRAILVEEWRVAATFFLGQNVNFGLEFRVRSYRTRLADNHTAADLILFNTTEQETYVVTSFTPVEDLAEHFNTGYCRGQVFSTHTEDLNRVASLNNTAFDTTCGNSSTTCDREHVFNRHQEVLIDKTNRKRDVFVNRLHQFLYLFNPLGFAVQRTECRTADDRDFIAREVVRRKEFANFHFNEVEQFRVVNQVNLVHEHNKRRHTYLTSEQNVFAGLRHRTISSCNHQDGTVHLSRSGNHVLH